MFFQVAVLDLIFTHAMFMFSGKMRLLDTLRDSLGAKTARGYRVATTIRRTPSDSAVCLKLGSWYQASWYPPATCIFIYTYIVRGSVLGGRPKAALSKPILQRFHFPFDSPPDLAMLILVLCFHIISLFVFIIYLFSHIFRWPAFGGPSFLV